MSIEKKYTIKEAPDKDILGKSYRGEIFVHKKTGKKATQYYSEGPCKTIENVKKKLARIRAIIDIMGQNDREFCSQFTDDFIHR